MPTVGTISAFTSNISTVTIAACCVVCYFRVLHFRVLHFQSARANQPQGCKRLPHFCQTLFQRLMQTLRSTVNSTQNASKHTSSQVKFVHFRRRGTAPPIFDPGGEGRRLTPLVSTLSPILLHLLSTPLLDLAMLLTTASEIAHRCYGHESCE